MKIDINDVLRDAEQQIENSNALRNTAVVFVILTSLFLAYHSFHLFLRLAGGKAAGNGAYANAFVAVGCVEASLIALIICHFSLFTTTAQKWIGIVGEIVTYICLLFHAALNFRQNLFGYLDGFGHFYESNGLPVLVFGATLGTWAAIILLDVRAKMRITTLTALSAQRERDLRGVLKDRSVSVPASAQRVESYAQASRGDTGLNSPNDMPYARHLPERVTPANLKAGSVNSKNG